MAGIGEFFQGVVSGFTGTPLPQQAAPSLAEQQRAILMQALQQGGEEGFSRRLGEINPPAAREYELLKLQAQKQAVDMQISLSQEGRAVRKEQLDAFQGYLGAVTQITTLPEGQRDQAFQELNKQTLQFYPELKNFLLVDLNPARIAVAQATTRSLKPAVTEAAKIREAQARGEISADEASSQINLIQQRSIAEIQKAQAEATKAQSEAGLATAQTQQIEKSTKTGVEKEQIETRKLLRQYDSIIEAYEPKFLKLSGELGGSIGHWLDRLPDPFSVGYDAVVSAANKILPKSVQILSSQGIKDFAAARKEFTTQVQEAFFVRRQQITGTQAALKELDDLLKTILNPNMGPTEFLAVIKTSRAVVAAQDEALDQIRREGLDPTTPEGGARFDAIYLQKKQELSASHARQPEQAPTATPEPNDIGRAQSVTQQILQRRQNANK